MSPAGTQIWSRRRFQSIDSMYINHTVDGSEIRETPPGTYKKNRRKSWDNKLPTSTVQDFFHQQ